MTLRRRPATRSDAPRHPRASIALLVLGGLALAAVAAWQPGLIARSASLTWQPFVLVAGLLLVGVTASADGLFEAAGSAIAGLEVGPVGLCLASVGLVAVVTAVLNLDTSVVFLTPVLLHAARRRGLDEAPFLYGAVFMSNAASMLLPGANLTNLLVLARERLSGAGYLAAIWPAALAAVVATAVVLLLVFRRHLRPADARSSASVEQPAVHPRFSSGAVGTLAVVVLVLVERDPAIPVLLVGIVVALAGIRFGRSEVADAVRAVDVPLLAGVFALAVALGVVGRSWSGPSHLLRAAGPLGTAGTGAIASVVVNNLPATVLLAARGPAHASALLVGVNLGPNLAVTGALSSLLWMQVARGAGARPSPATYSRIGVVLVPASMGLALLALWLVPGVRW